LRGLFIIDKEGVIQHSTINNLAIGRSVDETKRTLQVINYTTNQDKTRIENFLVYLQLFICFFHTAIIYINSLHPFMCIGLAGLAVCAAEPR